MTIFEIVLLILLIFAIAAHILYLEFHFKKLRFLFYLRDELKEMIDKESEEDV